MNPTAPGLARGERAPDFVLPCQDGTPVRFYARAGGHPAVLLFCNTVVADELLHFSALIEQGAKGPVSILAVQGQPREGGQQLPHSIFHDAQGAVSKTYRLEPGAEPVLFVLDPNLRVLASLQPIEPEATARQVATVLAASLPAPEPLELAAQAPVLLVPNVLERETCDHLIDVWETRGHEATGVEQSRDGSRVDVLDPGQKSRHDHIVRDEELLKSLSSAIGRRVLSEVYKAFAYRATRFEGFKIVCYDSTSGGFFRSHRDNLSPSTAHRRFALTLNLNADYEGGQLRFPEYVPHLYRPDAGAALLFSCSHLHEVIQVTKGRRFALLSFLFGEDAGRAPASKEKGS